MESLAQGFPAALWAGVLVKLPSGEAIGIAVAIAALLVLGGGVAYVAYDRAQLRELLRSMADRLAIPPEWLWGMARQESSWNPRAVNNTGPDALRGGSYGLLQISLKTARGLGFTGEPEELFDPAKHVYWAERYLRARPGGVPRTLDNLAAWWNAGRTSIAVAPESAKTYARNLAVNAAREA